MKNAAVIVVTLVAFAAGLFGIKMVLPQPAEAGEAEGAVAEADTLTAAQALEEATDQPVDSLVSLPIPDAPVGEVERLKEQLTLAQDQIPVLLERLDQLEQELTARQDRYERAKALAGSIGRLEDDELRALLVQLDGGILAEIYIQASPRNRTKLLQVLPAKAGADLVERIAYGTGGGRARTSEPTSRPPAGASAPQAGPPAPAQAPE